MTSENQSPQGTQSSYLEELIGRVLSQPKEAAAVPSSVPEPDASEPVYAKQAGTDPISALLQNPELIAKLPTILSAAKPIMEIFGSLSKQNTATAPTSAASVAAFSNIAANQIPSKASSSSPPKSTQDRHIALLCAMKPYLSDDRQKAVDYILKLRNLGDVLKSLN